VAVPGYASGPCAQKQTICVHSSPASIEPLITPFRRSAPNYLPSEWTTGRTAFGRSPVLALSSIAALSPSGLVRPMCRICQLPIFMSGADVAAARLAGCVSNGRLSRGQFRPRETPDPARHRGRPPVLHDQPPAAAQGTSRCGTDQRPGNHDRLTPGVRRLPVVTVRHEVLHRGLAAAPTGPGGHRGDRRAAGPARRRVRAARSRSAHRRCCS
jgi:hypothetical protein